MYLLNLSDFPKDTHIFLNGPARHLLFGKLEQKHGSLGQARGRIGIQGSDLYSWKNGYENKRLGKVNRYVPLGKLNVICKDVGVDVNSIQNQVEEIKANSKAGIIRNPKMPLEILPETFAVLGHFLSDGYGGENGNACYVSKSKEGRDNFISKLKIAFGNVEYHIIEKHWRVIVAKIVPKILKKYFQIQDFRTGKVVFPENIFGYPRKYLVELLKAMIIDEGRINDGGIWIMYSPKSCLTEVARVLCLKLGYKVMNHKASVIVSCKSFSKVKEDMGDFVIPSKQEMFLKYFKRKARGWYNHYRGNTRKKVLTLLSERNYSIKELAIKLNVGEGAIRGQINGYNFKCQRVNGLLDIGLVEVKEIGWRNARIFGIKS